MSIGGPLTLYDWLKCIDPKDDVLTELIDADLFNQAYLLLKKGLSDRIHDRILENMQNNPKDFLPNG